MIDSGTPGTLGVGVYTHPELSWDAQKVLFCFKGSPDGNTSIYEIGIDGTGLRRLTDPGPSCVGYKGNHNGQHDIAPAYLPDGRIVLLSTRPSGLVPCNNTGVAILHVMNADGSNLHPISVNFVNEFDPTVLPDGRILFGRWEYVDKNALTIQSLWTVNPDGTQETALYANNMVFPEAILDARPVPGTSLVVGTLAKHNGPPRGSIAFIDPALGKNNPAAIANLEHPNDPTFDQGDSCEPWPVSADVVVFSGRPSDSKRNVIEIMDRNGHREVLLSDPEICLHSPMLVKPRPAPPVIPEQIKPGAQTGRFFVQDIYNGLDGVKRGEVKWLRIIEETSRISASTMKGSPYNQTFLVSAALAFSVKNFLGIVPVREDGSVYFEAPAGRALYFQALDADMCLVQSMRTFLQAAPGTTRSCIGCHEDKSKTAPAAHATEALRGVAEIPRPESWGSGYVDYPSMIQPILDRHCVSCHGGEKGMAGNMDLSGGWTEYFNISYENLVNRRESQLVAWWIAGIDCMNGTAHWSSQIFPPRAHGSGAAPLARLLMNGHDGKIAGLTRAERDLLMAWIDSNGLYHGTWDSTTNGCAIKNWKTAKDELIAQMQAAGCVRCHGNGKKESIVFEDDWFNFKNPELSRILRAPLPTGSDGLGLGLCRDRKASSEHRLRLLVEGYAHAVKPIKDFPRRDIKLFDSSGEPVPSFSSTADSHYQAMLKIVQNARQQALLSPRIDLPGAESIAGEIRQWMSKDLPETLPRLSAEVIEEGMTHLSWPRSADLVGLTFEIHRGKTARFKPGAGTLLGSTTKSDYIDGKAVPGEPYYALVIVSDAGRSKPIRTRLKPPSGVAALPLRNPNPAMLSVGTR